MRARNVVAAGFRAYKRLVSPFMPRACRFHPTCSEYAAEAVEVHGAVKEAFCGGPRVALQPVE
jgi:putative membrane protein insertion efficiency factor